LPGFYVFYALQVSEYFHWLSRGLLTTFTGFLIDYSCRCAHKPSSVHPVANKQVQSSNLTADNCLAIKLNYQALSKLVNYFFIG
jgi:hypothetical protein